MALDRSMADILSSLMVSEISNFKSIKVHRIFSHVLLNQTKAYFRTSLEIHRFTPCFFWIRWPRFTSDDSMLEIYFESPALRASGVSNINRKPLEQISP
jgi:hypothetical protein